MEVREKIPRLGNMLSICLFLKHVSLSMLMKKMSVVCQKNCEPFIDLKSIILLATFHFSSVSPLPML